MEKQIILQSIGYIVNNIALSFATITEIYKFMGQPSNDELEFTIAVGFLNATTKSPTRRIALSILLGYRHYTAHPSRESPSIQDLHDAILTLSSWYNEQLRLSKVLLSPMSEGELIVHLLGTAISSIMKHDILIEKSTQGLLVQRQLPESGPDDAAVITNKIEYIEENIEITDTLRSLRNSKWKDLLKQRKIIILDGKHANKSAKFLYWSGTVAYIRFKGEKESICVPIDRMVSVLYPKYTTPQWRE